MLFGEARGASSSNIACQLPCERARNHNANTIIDHSLRRQPVSRANTGRSSSNRDDEKTRDCRQRIGPPVAKALKGWCQHDRLRTTQSDRVTFYHGDCRCCRRQRTVQSTDRDGPSVRSKQQTAI